MTTLGNPHDREKQHSGVDLDTNIVIDGDIGDFLSGTTVHEVLDNLVNSGGGGGGGPFEETATAGYWRFIPGSPDNKRIYDADESAYLRLESGDAELNGAPNGSAVPSYFVARSDFIGISSTDEMDIYTNDGTDGGSAFAKVYFFGGHGLVITRLSADPSGPNSEEGQIYMNTTTHKFRGFNGTSWQDLN